MEASGHPARLEPATSIVHGGPQRGVDTNNLGEALQRAARHDGPGDICYLRSDGTEQRQRYRTLLTQASKVLPSTRSTRSRRRSHERQALYDDYGKPTVDADAGTVSATNSDSRNAIGAFSSENGSLTTIQGFLYAISALVIGAFLTVWTVQRTRDIAILKALGGSTGYLLRDALAQALVVLSVGAGAGGAIGVGLGLLAEGAVPFALTAATTALPVVAMVALGMLGAAVAVRRITSVDPLTALGGAQ